MLVVSSVIWFIISTITSILMHPIVYGRKASSFSKLRGGPAVGITLAFIAAFTNLEILRQKYKTCSTDNNLLALALAFCSVGAGVLGADMWRGWRKGKK